MNIIIHLILLCQYGFVRGDETPPDSLHVSLTADYDCPAKLPVSSSLPLDNLMLDIKRESGEVLHVNLKQTQRVLANEYLPIWILNRVPKTKSAGEDDSELQLNNEVMKQLGTFRVYQESKTFSAAIYFDKRREFDGMIGCELYIRKLSVDILNRTRGTSMELGKFGVYSRPEYSGHQNNRKTELDDPRAGVNDQKLMKTYQSHVYDGYPEILVIVSWDVAKHWTQNVQEADHYITIVSQVLTLFNGVDMLYSKLKNTKIQINIAGIIIVKGEQSLPSLRRCYHPTRSETGRIGYWMDGVCTNSLIRLFLHNYMEKIPQESYDLAIFLTRENLFKFVKNFHDDDDDDQTEIFHPVFGISSGIEELYACRKAGREVLLVGSITSKEYLENYVTIAHEIAHLMTVKHDKPPSFTQDGECCGSILKTIGVYCDKCLSWSETSEETFNSFFSSPNCCTFINKPRSLNPPGQQQMLTADEQCQCYGYKSARKFREFLNKFCSMNLECLGTDNEFHSTNIPMDGTPCKIDGVCWLKLCVQIETPTVILSQN